MSAAATIRARTAADLVQQWQPYRSWVALLLRTAPRGRAHRRIPAWLDGGM
ncbi:hypothetical protein [Nocardia aurea]|uniref:hypothetical protein n=1 Tax=Nocardia aurea TaxID=2144174 RepID=UPI0013006187|nr:hypothetical protein [Nocardia aurea]